MARLGFLIDLTRCVGCQACTVACQNWNGLDPDERFTRVARHEEGDYPELRSTFVVRQCLHCEEPPCAEVCPTGATYKTAGGPVLVDDEACIGCRYCVTACPYEARVFDDERRVVRKCSMCFDRLAQGQRPVCSQTCLGQARICGDLDDPESEVSRSIAQPGVVKVAGTSVYFRLPEGVDRAALPPDFKAPTLAFVWQSIVQPLGQALMGAAAAAAAVSLAVHGLRALRERGKDHGRQG
ncbi:4Fe-4S dicluster domain-containing protein [Caldinitratiruptor microaerophilus]|uniref:4Fe-4S ferredoxin n=1 Tax=Caldinitratiruptor microaerophilus TaxID=671077 RepID=A0AA35CL42_9FIRM|nr:4Fe-4S dicluster domain-containing protein [Caldinitratiruptor microaerophilus]BDG60519.1 4Fe-4S ferredoxin [Caldinitratiruptor microaerophilus]